MDSGQSSWTHKTSLAYGLCGQSSWTQKTSLAYGLYGQSSWTQNKTSPLNSTAKRQSIVQLVYRASVLCALPLKNRAPNAHAPVQVSRGRVFPLSLSQNMAAENVVLFGSLKVGDSFESFLDVQTKIKEIEDETTVQLYRRDCKTLVASMSRYPGRAGKAKPELKYYLLDYCCVFGGRRHKSRSTGDRINTKTLRQHCPATIKLGLSQDCQQLVVASMNETHNHEVSQNVYAHLPRQRKMTPDENAIAAGMLKLQSEPSAWAMLQCVVEETRADLVFYCGVCTEQIIDEDNRSIACDSCLQWTHFKCVGMKTAPKGRCWFCATCKRMTLK
ncbi:hypothetical protein LSAT2_029026 [Lamellibrachia satsuma]|nr:hypothetical protein LSAT2_029026 [Lamellibrachia satsuma]